MKFKKVKCLNHSYKNFLEENIASTANYYGISSKNTLERHIWIYEFLSQIQKRSNDRCVLKGGACAQLYIPLEAQRCTNDLDIATNLNKNKLKLILSSIEQSFKKNKIHIRIDEYIPKSVLIKGKTLPLTTFIVKIPLSFRENKKSIISEIKIDFMHVDINRLYKNKVNKPNILGLNLNFSPLAIPPYSIIGDKLLTFAVNSIGIESFKIDKLYTNIYDIFYIINSMNSSETLKAVSENITDSISMEYKIKNIKPVGINVIFNDILNTLYKLSIIDLNPNYISYNKHFEKFKHNCLQYNIRNILNDDTWSIMCLNIYLWTYALKHYIDNKSFSELKHFHRVIEEYEALKNLTEKEKTRYVNNIKEQLKQKNHDLLYKNIEDPLRLIYLYEVLKIMNGSQLLITY